MQQGIHLRRNGKQQACEPCRELKVSCDHTRPHCRRCLRKQAAARCIYHPAPMTRTGAEGVQGRLLTPKRTPGVSSDRLRKSPQGSTAAPFYPELNHAVQTSPHVSAPAPVANSKGNHTEAHNMYDKNTETEIGFSRTARYYGPTSFSSVFTENCLLDSNEDYKRRRPSSSQFGQPLLERDRSSAPAIRKNQIITALSNIPGRDVFESLTDNFQSQNHIMLNIVLVKHAFAGLWSTFGEQLSVPRTSEKLNLIADALFKNEEKPLPPTPDDGIEWLSTFTGPNLRFEMLGILFCFFGIAYQSLLDGDHRLSIPENQGRDRKQSSWRMKECADICLEMVWKISFLSLTVSLGYLLDLPLLSNSTILTLESVTCRRQVGVFGYSSFISIRADRIICADNEISVALKLCTLILESLCTGDESKNEY